MIKNNLIEVEKDSTYTFTYWQESNNTVDIPSTAKISIYEPDGTAIATDQNMSIAADGICTYAQSFSGYDSDRNYWVKYVLDSGTPVVRFFDIYKYPFVNNVTESDLLSENKVIKEGVFDESGTAESGTVNTLVDSKLKNYEDDVFNGGVIEIYQNDDIIERKITDFASSTGTVTFSPNTTAITTEKYALRGSYQEDLDTAAEQVQLDFKAITKRAYLVIDHYQLKWLIIYKFFERFYSPLRKTDTDEYSIQYKNYADKYNTAFQSMNLTYDEDEDEEIGTDEENQKIGEIKFVR